VLYFHGGAYAIGSAALLQDFTWRIGAAARAHVLYFDYRLAPEHPFPAALEDALTVYRWLAEEFDPRRIAFVGDSAGGGRCDWAPAHADPRWQRRNPSRRRSSNGREIARGRMRSGDRSVAAHAPCLAPLRAHSAGGPRRHRAHRHLPAAAAVTCFICDGLHN